MHFVISGTWGPTDPTRAMLPFIFAASAVQADDTVTLMLFHDAVLMAVEGAGAKLVPVGPPNRYEEVAAHPNVTLWAWRPCIDDTPPLFDAEQMHRALDNLILNAIENTPAGGSIEVAAEHRADKLCLRVRDSGQGVPDKYPGTLVRAVRNWAC